MSAYAVLDALAGIVDAPVAMAAAVLTADSFDEAYDVANEASRFEFGSIGKTMTAQVLASLVLEGVCTLDDEIGTWLDAGTNAAITLRQLATHTSGLPRMAPNAWDHEGYDDDDPYATYTAELAEAGLRASSRDSAEYSNFGLQLLGLALERITGTPFRELLRRYVFEPFGLATATPGLGDHQVQRYAGGDPTPSWSMLLLGPGGVCGTLRDLVAWGTAVLDPPPTMQFALDNDLGWLRNGPLVWHNGGTSGGKSCLVVDPEQQRIAATLVATHDLDHVDDVTFLACVGRDPFDARPLPADERFDEVAVRVLDLMGAQRWNDVCALMTPNCAERLSAAVISGAWEGLMGPRGGYLSAAAIRAKRVGGAIAVALELSFSDGEGQAEVSFNDDGKLVGMRIA